MITASAYPALVLNADYQPLSYFPLSLWNGQDTIRAIFLDRVAVVCHYDVVVRSPGNEIRLPSVVALKQFVPRSRRPAFTRFNVYLRDRWCCQYCGERFPTHELTFDHVVPRSRGGRSTWENLVACCRADNLRKGHRLPSECGMRPLTKPAVPTVGQLARNARLFPPSYLHESWRDYLYWDSEIEP
jgi:5-methylcytosine-specific restriction endonuclease McrA